MHLPQAVWTFIFAAILQAWCTTGALDIASKLKTSFAQFEDLRIYYHSTQHAGGPVVMLLTDSNQHSSTWEQTGTVKALQDINATAVAVDLPGTGNSTQLAYDDAAMRAEVLHAVFQHFQEAKHKILVASGSSGRYAMPFIEQYGYQLSAFVPVGLTGVNSWQGPGDMGKQVRVLSLYGERDKHIDAMQLLWAMFTYAEGAVGPAHQVYIPQAGAACYIDDPATFNSELVRFLLSATQPPQQ